MKRIYILIHSILIIKFAITIYLLFTSFVLGIVEFILAIILLCIFSNYDLHKPRGKNK